MIAQEFRLQRCVVHDLLWNAANIDLEIIENYAFFQ